MHSPSNVRQFLHRRNDDESLDSVCLECLQTIASVTREDSLAEFEREHICNPVDRDHFDEVRTQHPHRGYMEE